MKKGISTIIASIILVVITIGLISTAYLYFAGIVSVGPVVSIASAFCDNNDDIKITIRNEGTSSLDLAFSDFLVNGTVLASADVSGNCLTGIDPGASETCTIVSVTNPTAVDPLVDGRLYNVKVLGTKNQAGGPVNC